MPRFIRRSLLMVDMTTPSVPEWALEAGSDVLILNFEVVSSENGRALSQSQILESISSATQSTAEIFIRVRREAIQADLEAAVWPGLTGVILPKVEYAQEVQEVSQHLAELEERRSLPEGSLQIDAEIGTAMGVWNSLEIGRASNRLAALTVGETSLYHDLCLNPEANLDQDPLDLIKFQIITNARACGIQPQGMSYPLSITLAEVEEAQLKQAVRRARDMGFKGAICPYVSWVKICNEGFRPSEEELTYYRKVREAFADGLRQGLAFFYLEGRMIDTPVDLRAKVFLEWGDRCARRDAEKPRAISGNAR